MQVRPLERALDLHPTVSAYDSLSVVVRSDFFFIRPLGFALSQKMSHLALCFVERSLHSVVLRKLPFLRRSLPVSDFLSNTDRDIVDALVQHRVATAAHLSALLEIPERTIRYRLTQLRTKGYARAVRPPADKGSAPDHWCPTRKADSWAKGIHSAQGGDRHAPSTTFVEHSAAITSLYVALIAAAGLGLRLIEWFREAKAAEEFEWRGRARKIVPDAFVVVADKDCECRAFIEVDLGSMSMTRLSQKLSAYAAYYAAQAWTERHPFAPVLLLLTTSDSRAEAALRRFQQRCTQAERHLHSSGYLAREAQAPEMAACAAARNADEAVAEPVWLSSGGGDGLFITDLLRPVWQSWADKERARLERERRRGQWRRDLAAEPERCRAEIQHSGSLRDFEALADTFDDNESLALKLLLNRTAPMNATERAAFSFFSARLSWTRREVLTASTKPQLPSADEARAVNRLSAEYLDRQRRYLARLWARCPEAEPIRKAIDHLDQKSLLRSDEIARLPALIAANENGALHQQHRQRAYMSWRARAVENRRRQRRRLARFVYDRQRAAYDLDLKRLWYCRRCHQIAVPRDHDRPGAAPPECSFCNLRAEARLAEAVAEGVVRPDEEGFWEVCQRPVPAWATEEAARPLSQSTGPDEEW